MRIRVSKLRELIREVAISPSIKKQRLVDDPLRDETVVKTIGDLNAAFKRALELDLTVRLMDTHYDEKTREFDDETYDTVSAVVSDTVATLNGEVSKMVSQSWKTAHDKMAPQQAKQKAA